jgi:SAM-dependent methyltransferase
MAPFFDPRPAPHVVPEGGLHAPATARNREPILEVLRRVLPPRGLVLEIASGTGEHAVFFASSLAASMAGALPALTWQPSDPRPEHLASIAAWRAEAGTSNLRPPLGLDVEAEPWPVDFADAIVCINMLHIAPWSACEALMGGAARILPDGGILYTYGPYKRDGRHTAPSNAAFDERLRAEDPRWGVRDLADVAAEAARVGLALAEIVEMPANNLSLVFRKGPVA